VHRFVAYLGDEAVSSGNMTIFDDLRFGFFWAGSTLPEHQGKGFYSAVVAARIAFAKQRGLEAVGVYARKQTSSPIVARQGFVAVGEMAYWDCP
jgi:GNAT superfamily N-acetyltransferase